MLFLQLAKYIFTVNIVLKKCILNKLLEKAYIFNILLVVESKMR